MMIAMLFLCYTLIAWQRPRVALGLLLALLPTYVLRFAVGGIPMTVLEGFILILAVRTLLGRGAMRDARSTMNGQEVIVRSASPFADRFIILAVAWVIVGALAAMWSDAGVKAWGLWKAYIVEPVLLYATIRALHAHLNVRTHVIFPLAAGAAGIAAVAVWQHWSGYGIPFPWQDFTTRRVTGVFGYPNAVGLYLAPIIPLALGLLSIERRASSSADRGWRGTGQSIVSLIVVAAVFCVAITAVFFTRGAGAFVAVTAAFVAFPCIALGKRWLSRHHRGAAVTIVIAWVAVCLALTAWLPYQPERPRTGTQAWQKLTFQQWSGSVRLAQYREMWQLLRDHPLRGAGLSGYPQAIQQYKEKQNVETFQYPHNLLLAVWSETGLLGLLFFLGITAVWFAHAFAARRPTPVVAAMVAVLVFGFVDIPIFKNDLAALWWTLLALGTVQFGSLEHAA